MSKRYLVAAILVALIAVGVFLLQKQEKRSAPVPENVSIENREPVRSRLSTVEVSDGPQTATPHVTTNECPDAMTFDERREHRERLKAHFVDIAEVLSGSDDAEAVLAAALVLQLKDGNASLDALERASSLAPRSPLVAWNMLRTCRDIESKDCDLALVEANSIRADGDNGAVWMEIAMLRLAEGRPDAAIPLVQRAIAAPRFDSYFIDHAQIIERALEAGGDSTYTERMIAGIGFSAALVVSYSRITRHCRDIDAGDAIWIDLCHQIGEKMYADGRVFIDQAVGSSLVKIAAEHTHNQEEIAAATKRHSEFRKQHENLIPTAEMTNLMGNDEAVLRRYVEHLATFGEVEGMTRLRADAARLKETDGYDRCNFTHPYFGE